MTTLARTMANTMACLSPALYIRFLHWLSRRCAGSSHVS